MSASGRIGGPLPKPSDQRVRRHKDTFGPLRVVEVTPTKQPSLPKGIDWHPQTVKWWAMWKESPLAENFTDAEWSYLTDTARLHTEYWQGNLRLGGELRLRAAKFGVTPEDRARLRIQVVTADEVEAKAEARGNTPSSRGRYSAPSKAV